MELHLVHFNGLVLLAVNLSSRRGNAFTLKLTPMNALRHYVINVSAEISLENSLALEL
jgi:hypothetical protein